MSEVATNNGPAAKTAGGNAAYHNFHNDFVHIQDPNERRRLALAEIDKAPFGWYHVRYELPSVTTPTLGNPPVYPLISCAVPLLSLVSVSSLIPTISSP
jgi:hypothetical protein